MDSRGIIFPSTYIEFALEKADEAKDYPPLKSIPTKEFTLGGRQWRILCYPGGKFKEVRGVGVYLELIDPDIAHEVRVRFTGELPSGRTLATDLTFGKYQKKLDFNGFEGVISHRELAKLQYQRNKFKIACTIVMLRDNRIDVPASDVGSQLDALQELGIDYDVVFNVGGQLIPAHRLVVAARSKVFARMLCGEMSEARKHNVKIQGDAAPFTALVKFAYTDSLPSNAELWTDDAVSAWGQLLQLSDCYGMDRMKSLCAASLWDATTEKTVSRTLVFAMDAKCQELQDKCEEFIVKESNLMEAL
ncbi:hypothetical protein EJB05_33544, partial [Eragrostis curvula]